MEKISIIIIDDHKMFASGIGAQLEKEQQFIVLAIITDPDTIMDMLEKLKPQVVLMDIRMKEYNGLVITKQIKKQYGEKIKVILMSGYNIGQMAEGSGADAFTSKEESIASLTNTIQKVYTDQANVFPQKKTKILTPTELEVIQLLSEELTRKEIAKVMYISEKTVTNHITSILSKLEVKSRVGAILKAVNMGIIEGTVNHHIKVEEF